MEAPASEPKPPSLTDLRKLHAAHLKTQRCEALVMDRAVLAQRLVSLGILGAMPVWPDRKVPPPGRPRKQPLSDPEKLDPAKIDWDGAGGKHGGVAPALGNEGKRKLTKKEAYAAFLASQGLESEEEEDSEA